MQQNKTQQDAMQQQGLQKKGLQKTVQSIVIVGGGTAGWMTAAALSHFLSAQHYHITLIESDQIGTVGVGEATVPHIRYFNQTLGIDENEFIRQTNATYKLGIEFIDWGKLGDAYIHPFGIYGRTINDVSFHHYWLKAKLAGDSRPIGDYSLAVQAALQSKFSYPSANPESLASKYSYAFHIDASRYAQFLRTYAEQKGITRREGKIQQVNQCTDSGCITSFILDDGSTIGGDLFVDCSGFRGLLIEQTLQVGYDDWSQWLPCDRAIAVPSEKISPPLPYTKATAKAAGWQWRIPLQNRNGNGQVYCSHYVTEEQVAENLLASLDGKPLANLNHIRFTTGCRKKTWYKNCVAVGLSSGFLEPLESTSIYLIQMAITKLVEYFPRTQNDITLAEEFNRDMRLEYERVRDFLVLHYTATTRDDTEFWRYMRNMKKPASLDEKIALFVEQGHVMQYKKGMFLEPSWVAVYLGQGIVPTGYHPAVERLSKTELDSHMANLRAEINNYCTDMPPHSLAIEKHTNAMSNVWPPAALSLYEVFS